MPRTGDRSFWAAWLAIFVGTILVASSPSLAADKQASFVVDGNTGAVLHAQQADEPRYPASLTKMMTLYMAFEEIKAGRMSEDTMLTISATAAAMAPSKLGLKAGERISLGNAMKAVVTKSANDMACAIAEAISGSEAEFARRMTRRARAIGMTATTFRNASGLPDPQQLTTARDMTTLGLRLRDDFPDRYAIFQTRTFSYGGKTYRNHNTLMNGFGGMDGIKTGYTRASGFNLVSSVQRDGKYIVGAVFGGVSAGARNAHMRVVLFRALMTASTEKTRKAAPVLVARGPAKAPPPKTVAAPPAKPKVQVAAAPPAKKVEKAAEQKPVVAPPQAPAAAPQPVDDPAIKIAKVKAVMVAGQAPAPSVAPAARPKPQFVTASAAPRLDLGARAPAPPQAQPAPTPEQSVASNESIIAKARQPGTLNAQVSALAPDKAEDVGMRPSQQDSGIEQAHAIMGGAATPEPPAAPAASSASPRPTNGGYLIQVGAFASEAEARRHLDTVIGRAGDVLKDRRPTAVQAQVGARSVYRARFAEFDSAAANAACSTLRQQKVDCMVLKNQ
jgi:D-alanyl-D-alanine carboxypeptidase